jgi:hypothetical protein
MKYLIKNPHCKISDNESMLHRRQQSELLFNDKNKFEVVKKGKHVLYLLMTNGFFEYEIDPDLNITNLNCTVIYDSDYKKQKVTTAFAVDLLKIWGFEVYINGEGDVIA